MSSEGAGNTFQSTVIPWVKPHQADVLLVTQERIRCIVDKLKKTANKPESKAEEDEWKLITDIQNLLDPVPQVEEALKVAGLIILKELPPQHLVSRQYDTADDFLHSLGVTLRTRGHCDHEDLNSQPLTETCIKIVLKNQNGILMRKEFEGCRDYERAQNLLHGTEAVYSNAPKDRPDFVALRSGYPRTADPLHENNLLHDLIDEMEILYTLDIGFSERFRVDSPRQSFVVQIPNDILGLPPKLRASVILQVDEPVTVVSIDDTDETGFFRDIALNPSIEIEAEAFVHIHSCENYDGAEGHTCYGLTPEQERQANLYVRKVISESSFGELLTQPEHGKAERGFGAARDFRTLVAQRGIENIFGTMFFEGEPRFKIPNSSRQIHTIPPSRHEEILGRPIAVTRSGSGQNSAKWNPANDGPKVIVA